MNKFAISGNAILFENNLTVDDQYEQLEKIL